MKKVDLKSLHKFRKKLHQHAEIAHREKETAEIIAKYIKSLKPKRLIENIGGYGLIAEFQGDRKGKKLLFRAELDGLPIAESNTFDHVSKNEGWGHKCGHDGHMAILCGLAESLSDGDFAGTVYLLFQPAEETGEGAQKMLEDFNMSSLNVDFGFALHNLPAFPKGEIILKRGVFAAASVGVIIRLSGKPSHAGHPNNGINPTMAAMHINQLFFELPQMNTALNEVALITPVGTQIGQKAFGTSASQGEIYATLRTFDNANLKLLSKRLEQSAKAIAQAHHLKFDIEFVEEFQAVVNDIKAYEIVKKAVKDLRFDEVDEVFSWSEDFGQFSQIFPSCFVGLGAGEKQPQLHNENYDFPDAILADGIQYFRSILKTANNE